MNTCVFIYSFSIASWGMYCIVGNVDNVVVKQFCKDIYLRVHLCIEHCMMGSVDNVVVIILFICRCFRVDF